jgi:pilus assembly protein Flp/PilA
MCVRSPASQLGTPAPPSLIAVNVQTRALTRFTFRHSLFVSMARPKWTGSRNQPEKVLMRFITKFLADESGATAIEYGLLAALIAVVIISAATTLGTNVKDVFVKIATCIKTPGDALCK